MLTECGGLRRLSVFSGGITHRLIGPILRALLLATVLVSSAWAQSDSTPQWLPGSVAALAEQPPVNVEWRSLQDEKVPHHDWRQGGWVSWPVSQPDHDLLLIQKAWWRSAQAWVPIDGGGWARESLGFDHNNRGRLSSGRFLGLKLPPQFDRSRPVILWLEHDRPTSLQITTDNAQDYLKRDLIYLRLIMLFFGILLALTVYHLLIFVWLRQRAFGLYVLYLLCVGGFFLGQEGVLYLWQWPGWGLIGSNITNTLAAWTIAFATLFVSAFVHMPRHAPRFDRYLLRWPAYLLLANGLLSLFAGAELLSALSQISALGALIMTPMVIAAGVVAWRQSEVAGIYVTVAWSLVVLAVCYRVLYGFGLTPLNAITLYGTQIAVACEAMLLAIGLAHRIAHLRSERDAARASLAAEHRLLLHRQILNELGRGLAASRDADQVFSLTLAAVEKAFAPGGVLFIERFSGVIIAQRGEACRDLPKELSSRQLKTWRETDDCVMVDRPLDNDRALSLILLETRFDAKPRLIEEFIDMALPALRNVDYLKSVQHRADYDALTGLYSRAHFLEQAEHQLLDKRVDEVAVAFMDLDHFKQINDRYGHAVGDEILVTTGQRIRNCLREEELTGRYGGEEFVALFTNLSPDRAEVLCQRLRRAIAEQPYLTRVGPISVTLSIGLFTSTTPTTLDRLLDQADQRLYQAKKEGRNRVVS